MEDREDRTKCMSSFQLEKFMLDWLKKKAREECTSTSSIIRRLIVREMREEGEDN